MAALLETDQLISWWFSKETSLYEVSFKCVMNSHTRRWQKESIFGLFSLEFMVLLYSESYGSCCEKSEKESLRKGSSNLASSSLLENICRPWFQKWDTWGGVWMLYNLTGILLDAEAVCTVSRNLPFQHVLPTCHLQGNILDGVLCTGIWFKGFYIMQVRLLNLWNSSYLPHSVSFEVQL